MTGLFLNVLNLSISAGWLILAVLGLRLLLKRAPKWVNVVLWGMVAVRLLCPFTMESELSLIPDWKLSEQGFLSVSHGEYRGQILDSEGNVLAEKDMVVDSEIQGQILDSDGNIILRKPLNQTSAPTQAAMHDILRSCSAIWGIGMVLMLGYALCSYLHLKRTVATSVKIHPGFRRSAYIDSPFVLGIFRPVVYLPCGMDESALAHVIAHEQAHIRRKDHWWKPLGFLLLSIHWFHPLMWLAYVLLCRDIELACDEKVIAELGSDQRADYSQALVACSVNRRSIAACPLAFGEVGVKERVKSIMNYRKPTFWIIVTAVVLCVLVAVCFLTDPKPTPEFAMSGDNLTDLQPEQIVERIIRFQDIENSDVYVNANAYTLTVDADFDWEHSQTISYFFYENHKVRNAQLRIFPESNEYFLTEANDWPDQNRVYLLRHYLDAIKFLPQKAIREMAPADRYIIEHIDEGAPSDYDRVITYSAAGVGDTEGWYLHLRILPLHSAGEQYSGTGEEVVHLFYGDGKNTVEHLPQKWLDYTEDNSEMSYEQELTTQLEEFPGVTFCYTPEEIAAITESGERTVLFGGMPIWSVYFSDLNGDAYPEICSETSFGSGIIDNRILVYDYANGMSYLLEDRGNHDYYLRLDETDGHLYVDKCIFNSLEPVSSGRLRMEDFTAQIDGHPRVILMARVLDVYDEHFLVEPVEGSWEPARIEVPMKNMYPSPAIDVGDIIQIEYDGQIAETYPAKITNVYHISVAEQASAITMVPTDTELTGLQAGVLLVPMDGKTYRYALEEHEPEGVSADELLYSFHESDMGESILHEVYALREYPDRSKVLLLSEKDGARLCQYSPPLRCLESALNDAIAAGYVVEENGFAAYGQEIWREFYEKTQQGIAASVTVAYYYDSMYLHISSVYGYYQVFQQDYPCINVCQLSFDGNEFTLSLDGETRTYEYLMRYGQWGSQDSDLYVLTHDNRVTYDELWQSAASSQYGAYIDHFTIYTERKTQ